MGIGSPDGKEKNEFVQEVALAFGYLMHGIGIQFWRKRQLFTYKRESDFRCEW